jgi:hypothetical protein
MNATARQAARAVGVTLAVAAFGLALQDFLLIVVETFKTFK